jgi:hypothetical protein
MVRERDVNIWRTFMAITLMTAIVLGAGASALHISTPEISVTSFGTVLTVGDVIETVVAAALGAIATVLLRARRRT